jgi:hypothetical protein
VRPQLTGVGLVKGHPKSVSTSLEKSAAQIFAAARGISDEIRHK